MKFKIGDRVKVPDNSDRIGIIESMDENGAIKYLIRISKGETMTWYGRGLEIVSPKRKIKRIDSENWGIEFLIESVNQLIDAHNGIDEKEKPKDWHEQLDDFLVLHRGKLLGDIPNELAYFISNLLEQ